MLPEGRQPLQQCHSERSEESARDAAFTTIKATTTMLILSEAKNLILALDLAPRTLKT